MRVPSFGKKSVQEYVNKLQFSTPIVRNNRYFAKVSETNETMADCGVDKAAHCQSFSSLLVSHLDLCMSGIFFDVGCEFSVEAAALEKGSYTGTYLGSIIF